MSGLRSRRPNLARLEVDTFSQRILEEGRIATACTPIDKLTATRDRNVAREFQLLDDLLRKETQGTVTRLSRFNPDKDFCDDVLPYMEHGAQTLSGDYVNASVMCGTLLPNFIAAQGPLKTTVADFWSMIAQHRVTQIVALCADSECAGYLPNLGETLSLLDGALQIRLKEVNSAKAEGLWCSCLELTCGEETWEVTRFHCSAWGDEGTLPAAALLSLAEQVNTDAATVAHCRAGAGRTGCFIALCSLLADVQNQLRKAPGCVPCASIARTVMDLRKRRPHMVQTWQQYELLYSALGLWYGNLKAQALLVDTDDTASTTDGDASSEEGFTPSTATSAPSSSKFR